MKKIANFRFTYFPMLGLILGIVSSLFYYQEKYLTIFIINVVFLLLFNVLFYKNFRCLIINLITFIIFFCLGYYAFYFRTEYYLRLENPSGIYHVYGKVASINYLEDYNLLKLKNVTLEDGLEIKNLKILLKLDYRISVEVGDYVDCFANSQYLLNDFNFADMYYITEGITYSAEALDGVKVISSKRTLFESVSIFIKNSIFNNMSKSTGGVAYALVVGNVSYIPKSFNDLYKISGLFHIFSVSGFHISFITQVIYKLTKRLPINRAFIDSFIILVLFFYCGVCGFAICAIRSAIMSSLMLICTDFGEKYDIINSLLLSFIITLLFNPFNLLNVGCLLSYTSVLGLIILSRPVKKLFVKLPNFIGESLALSISATIMSMPITLYVFRSFAPMAILYNLVVVPLIYVIFLGLIIFIIISIFFSKLVFYVLCEKLILLLNWALNITKPGTYYLEKTVSYYFIFPYYLFAITSSDLIFLKTRTKLILLSIFFAISMVLIFI